MTPAIAAANPTDGRAGLSDEVLCERWVENSYYEYVCFPVLLRFFQHRLVLDRSSMTRSRNCMGEDRLQALLQESLLVATRNEAIKPSELSRVVVDTTEQPKKLMFPTDARLSLRRFSRPSLGATFIKDALSGVRNNLRNQHEAELTLGSVDVF